MLEFPQLCVFGTNEPLAATGAFLLPVDLLGQMLLHLVAILPLRSEQASVENMRLSAIMADGHVYLAQINACYLLTQSSSMRRKLIGGNGFVLSTRPVDHHRLRKFPRPIPNEWFVAFAIR